MRKQFIKTMKDVLYTDKKSILLLGDIGVFGFKDELVNIPSQVYNIGILEQSTVSLAAGLSKGGLIPFVHTIAPFMVERALEQLKIDFGYQNLNGNFISVGNSYDYAGLGCTHHCPGDVQILTSIPNMQIFVPGTSAEFDNLLKFNYNNGINYYRLSEYENKESFISEPGKGSLIKIGNQATIICFGNMLSSVIEACSDFDVTIIYYNSVNPFDAELLKYSTDNIIICEPFYEGTTTHIILSHLKNKKVKINNIGIPRKFLTNYGTKTEHDEYLKLDTKNIKERIKLCLI